MYDDDDAAQEMTHGNLEVCYFWVCYYYICVCVCGILLGIEANFPSLAFFFDLDT